MEDSPRKFRPPCQWWGLFALALLVGGLAWLPGRFAPHALDETPTTFNACAGVNAERVIVHGDLLFGHISIWANKGTTVTWPQGYTARFEPGLVVYDTRGDVRAREGDDLLIGSGAGRGLYVCVSSNSVTLVQLGFLTPR
jgi:hypothetical protein